MTTSPAREFDREYFDRNYRDYERQNPLRKLLFYRRFLERLLSRDGRRSILEIGCGPGAFLASLDDRWHKYGFDVSPYAIQLARKRNPGARLVVGSAERVPFARQFDAIVSFDVLEHVSDAGRALDEVASHLAPGGVFACVVPVYDGLSGPIIRRLDRDPTHVHRRERTFWLSLIGRQLQIESWCGIVRYLLPGGWYLNWPTKALRRHAPAVAIVARR
jgi:SAM-dependent methyltransferase